MFIYRIDILDALKRKGYTTTRIRREKLFGESTLTKFRKQDTDITLKTIDILLSVLGCEFEDVFEFYPEEIPVPEEIDEEKADAAAKEAYVNAKWDMRKYKELLDLGLISQEKYDKKKTELMKGKLG